MDQKIIRKPALFSKIGLSDATSWRMEKKGDFPKRLRLGGNSCGWLETEVNQWIEGRLADRHAKA